MIDRSCVIVLDSSPRGAGVSRTRVVASLVEAALRRSGVAPVAWHLSERPLPQYRPLPGGTTPPEVEEFVELAERAAGMVIAVPVYHGTFNGIFKDAFDWLSSAQLRGKIAALCCQAGGVRNAIPLSHLRDVTRSVGMITLPHEVATSGVDFREDENGRIFVHDADLLERIETLAIEMAKHIAIRAYAGEALGA